MQPDSHKASDRETWAEPSFRRLRHPVSYQHRTQLTTKRSNFQPTPTDAKTSDHTAAQFRSQSPSQSIDTRSTFDEWNILDPSGGKLALRRPPCDQEFSVRSSDSLRQPPNDRTEVEFTITRPLGITKEASKHGSESLINFSNNQREDINDQRKSGTMDTRIDEMVIQDNQETRTTKRGVPFWKCSSRKRQFVSPSSSRVARSSTKDSGNLSSFDELLMAVGKRNKTLEHDLNQSDCDNQILKAKINNIETESRKYKEHMKDLAHKIKTEKAKVDVAFAQMKSQVSERFSSEKRQLETCSEKISLLRNEVKEYLEAFRNFHDKTGIQDDKVLGPNDLQSLNYHGARKALNMAKEIDEDRHKKQSVIGILRQELEIKSGQVTEMSQRILELENLSFQQSLHMLKGEESWNAKIETIHKSVERRSQLILDRLDEKSCLERERLLSVNETLEKQVLLKEQGVVELSKSLEALRCSLGEAQKSLNVEVNNNLKHVQESHRLGHELNRAKAKRNLLEKLLSKVLKEKVQQEGTSSKIAFEIIELKAQNAALSESVESKQTRLVEADQEIENFKSTKLNERVEQLQEFNLSSEAEKAGLSSHLAECQLKIKALEVKEKDMQQFVAVSEKQQNTLEELQIKLDCTLANCEDLRTREHIATGQVNILREELTETKESRMLLNLEVKKLQDSLVELSVKKSELETFGESRRSKETIERILSEQAIAEMRHRDELGKLENEHREVQEKLREVQEEAKKQKLLFENSENIEARLQTELKTVQGKLEQTQNELNEVKASHALQVATTANLLKETERQASESCKQAASVAREKIIATLERKYELMLMNANNEKKRLENKLTDSGNRLLAMSTELAKLKGKPNLEEFFLSSETNEQVPTHSTKKRSSTPVDLVSSTQVDKKKASPEPGELQDYTFEHTVESRPCKRDKHKKSTGTSQSKSAAQKSHKSALNSDSRATRKLELKKKGTK